MNFVEKNVPVGTQAILGRTLIMQTKFCENLCYDAKSPNSLKN
jgi:hypothetical protein